MGQRYYIWLLNLLLLFVMAGFTVNKYRGPVAPIIIKAGDSITLHASTTGAVIYQWYKDGQPILGANLKDFIAKQAGSYVVAAYNNESCVSQPSDPIDIEIAPKLLIIADDKTKVYGTPNPTLTLRYQGFVNGDGPGVLSVAPTLSTTATIKSDVGAYPIVPSGAQSNKYTISYQNGTLTITKAPLTIMAKNDSKFKDGIPYTTGNGVVYSGFVNGDTPGVLNGSLTYTGNAIGSTDVGLYSIMPSGFTAANYQITYIPGMLSVTDKTVDMSVLKVSETRSVRVGEAFTYTLTVDNKSAMGATQVQLKDVLPAELDYVNIATVNEGTPTYDAASRTLTWQIGNMAPSQTATLTLTVKANTHGTIKNSADVTSLEKDANLSNNTSTDTKNIDGLYIPNVFTPNNDGTNDTFVIPNLGYYPGNEIVIFNRWGNVIYQKKGYMGDWDGSGLNEGTYFYILKVTTNANTVDIYKGYVTLLRSKTK